MRGMMYGAVSQEAEFNKVVNAAILEEIME